MTRATRRTQKRRRWPLYLASSLLVLAILFTVYYIVFLQQKPVRTQVHLQPGMAAPDFQLDAVRGGTVHMADYTGCVVLLSFISTQSNTSSSSDPSNSQVVVLENMQQQYNSNGLRIIVVDATALLTGEHPDQDTLLNYTYTVGLGAIPLVDDSNGTTAQNYGVTSVPTTFLIGQDGQVNQRWNGLASSSQLTLFVQTQIGTPGVPDTAAQTQCPAPQG